jgi:hypothetical protein
MDENLQLVDGFLEDSEDGVSLEDYWHTWSMDRLLADLRACDSLVRDRYHDGALERILERTCASCLADGETLLDIALDGNALCRSCAAVTRSHTS